LLVLLTSCSTRSEQASEGSWVGTITTEGNVTTVVNESGSVWGGAARLVEEASIGVEAGAEEYLFGSVAGVHADGEQIFVLDQQVRRVRVYDYRGEHLRDIGRQGQGPGEFANPCDLTGAPDGRLFVLGTAANGGRLNVFGADDQPLLSRPVPQGFQCRAPSAVSDDGILWMFSPTPEFDIGIRGYRDGEPVTERMMLPGLEYTRWTFTSRGREVEAVPWAPRIVWGISPVGALLAGASEDYRFQVRYPDERVTIIGTVYEPVTVSDAERDYWTLLLPRRIPDDEAFSWDGRLPEHKRPYEAFLGTYSGEIWVLREGRADPIPDCDSTALVEGSRGPMPQRCFEQAWLIDAFEIDGRYLGRILLPDGVLPGGSPTGFPYTFVRGDTVIAMVTDEAGTAMVKRYRLVLPGEE
jgi:hypothetical protein